MNKNQAGMLSEEAKIRPMYDNFHCIEYLLRGVIGTAELRIKFCPHIWKDSPLSFTSFGTFRRHEVNSVDGDHARNAAFVPGMRAGHYHLLQLMVSFE